MSGYFYLDISIILSEKTDSVHPIFIKGGIEQSLRSVFGEIGGQTKVDILKFDRKNYRGIIRIPAKYYVKTRAAVTLISQFQDINCHFKVNAASQVLFSLIDSHFYN